MKPATIEFVKQRFAEYYQKQTLAAPSSLEQREWGFVFFDTTSAVRMRRHMAFADPLELTAYVRSLIPAHAYYSTAYYQTPSAPTMNDKHWAGADLIFDLDADHLRNAPTSYNEMLEFVKAETLKLLDFLTGDFGFGAEEVQVVFSGGRGYHIHVRDPRVTHLGSGERREIVDYLTGRGLDLERFMYKQATEGDFGIEKGTAFRCPPGDAPGWAGRVNKSVLSFVRQIHALDKEEAISQLSSRKGIGTRKAARFYEGLMAKDEMGEDIFDKINRGLIDLSFGSPEFWKMLIKENLEGVQVQLSQDKTEVDDPLVGLPIDRAKGETDEPVTTDVKRLIRFPLSLHGGTGLRVTPLTISGLAAFDPLRDAVVFGDRPVEVCLRGPYAIEMKGESFDLEEGPTVLPQYAAVFLAARKVAELGKALDR